MINQKSMKIMVSTLFVFIVYLDFIGQQKNDHVKNVLPQYPTVLYVKMIKFVMNVILDSFWILLEQDARVN